MKFLSALMIAIGLLMVWLGGLCTKQAYDSGAATGLALVAGASFLGLGLMFVVGGIVIWRQPPER